MTFAQDAYTTHVVARITEYVDEAVPWQRSLWQLGTSLVLREVVEYAEQLRRGAIKEEGLKYVAQAAHEQCQRDPAIGDASLSASLSALLANPRDLRNEYSSAQLAHLANRVGQGYLRRWAGVLRASGSVPSAERLSRLVSASLLDAEISPRAIKEMLQGLAEESGGPIGVADLCESAANLAEAPQQRFKILIPFQQLKDAGKGREPTEGARGLTLLDAATAKEQMGDKAASFEPLAGAIVLHVTAMDPAAAVSHGQELLARLLARLAVSPSFAGSAVPHDQALVLGLNELHPLPQQRRAVRVPSIDRTKSILRVKPYAEADALDDALELLAYFEQGTPGAALTGGWAALESLLVLPTDNDVLAADRLAAIIACDFPRAELTWLAHAPIDRAATDPGVIASITATSVSERVRKLERAISQNAGPTYVKATDNAGLERVKDLLAQPGDGLRKIRQSVAEGLRRLYMQRNIVMHAGSLASVTRRATIRTIPTLAGAGVDRLVNAAAAEGLTPIQLAARAEAELGLLASSLSSRPLCDLLQ